MGKMIRTVLGEIEPKSLGLASMHDHIFYDGSAECLRLREAIPTKWPQRSWLPMADDEPVSLENVGILQRNAMLSRDAFRQMDEAELTEELHLYKAAGGEAILSLGLPRGQEAQALRRISKATGVHIVEAADHCTEDFKSGHLASSLHSASREEERALRAVARCAKETGLSLTVSLGGDAVELADCANRILLEEGISPERVVLAGVPLFTRPSLAAAIQNPASVSMDTALALQCLDRGYNLSVCITSAMGYELAGDYDCGDFLSFAGLHSLVEKGYCKQLVLGNDCRGKIMLHGSGGEGYCRLLYYVLPMLRNAAGLSDYAIRRMTVENPAEILAV